MSNYKVKLKEIRKSKGLNQTELAKELDTIQQVVSDYENGVRTPSLDRLVELAQILDVSLDELVEFKKIQRKISKELKDGNF